MTLIQSCQRARALRRQSRPKTVLPRYWLRMASLDIDVTYDPPGKALTWLIGQLEARHLAVARPEGSA